MGRRNKHRWAWWENVAVKDEGGDAYSRSAMGVPEHDESPIPPWQMSRLKKKVAAKDGRIDEAKLQLPPRSQLRFQHKQARRQKARIVSFYVGRIPFFSTLSKSPSALSSDGHGQTDKSFESKAHGPKHRGTQLVVPAAQCELRASSQPANGPNAVDLRMPDRRVS